MTLRYLLDTSIVSAPMAKIPNPQIIRRFEEHGHESAMAAPVWHELVYGSQRLPKGKRRDAIEHYLTNVARAIFPVLPYDEAAAAWHGRERTRLESVGKPAPFTDGQIAAIAQVHGLILVTLNVKDFARFTDVDVTNWTQPRRR